MDKKWFITKYSSLHNLNDFNNFFIQQRNSDWYDKLSRGFYLVFGQNNNRNFIFGKFYSKEEADDYLREIYEALRSL